MPVPPRMDPGMHNSRVRETAEISQCRGPRRSLPGSTVLDPIPCSGISGDVTGDIHARPLCSSPARGAHQRGVTPTDGTALDPSDHALGRSRGGFGSKIHWACDGKGLPLAVMATSGQRHESTQFKAVMEAVRVPVPVGRPRRRPRRLVGDEGYTSPQTWRYLRRRGIKAVIPTRKEQRRIPTSDKPTYRRRNVVERCIGWLRGSRSRRRIS